MRRCPRGSATGRPPLSLLAFVWLELVPPESNTTLADAAALLRLPTWRCTCSAATYFGSRWFDRGDGFEVFSSLLGRLSVFGRRGDGRLVRAQPARRAWPGYAEGGRDCSRVVGVLLGSTVYDSLSSAPWWDRLRVQDRAPLHPRLLETLGLVGAVAVVTAAVRGRVRAERAGAGRAAGARAAGEFAHTLDARSSAGYVVAHYWSLLVIVGQQTVIQLSDPLGTGANWLGTGGRGIDSRLADPTSWRCCRSARRRRPRARRGARARPRGRAAAAAARGRRAAADAGADGRLHRRRAQPAVRRLSAPPAERRPGHSHPGG